MNLETLVKHRLNQTKIKRFGFAAMGALCFLLLGHPAHASITNYGTDSGQSGAAGSYFGRLSGQNATGTHTSCFGYATCRSNTGTSNSFFGSFSGYNNSTGEYNSFFGQSSGYSNTTGSNNAYFGHWTGNRNTTGGNNAAFGYRAGRLNTTGSYNTFSGAQSGYSNETGNLNTYTGYQAGYTATAAHQNTFNGAYSGFNTTTGSYNTFMGHGSGYSNTTGYANVFVGRYSGYRSTTGLFNTHLGYLSGFNATIGRYNTFMGAMSGYSTTTGLYNTYVGYSSGRMNKTGYRNVFIGYNAGHQELGSDKLYIANSSTKTPLIGGDFSAKTVTINGTLTQTSDRRLKKRIKTLSNALQQVMKLRGVSYKWKKMKGMKFPKGKQIGFIAQEVEKVAPSVVIRNSNGYKSVSYANLNALLVEGMKQQQKTIEAQRAELNRMKKAMKLQMKELKSYIAQKMIKKDKQSVACVR